ncbi:hypothetical protein ACD661_05880 [Legionella lytica]|uniref:Coiled-coil protein n=1 Tax=Legionella lytica TaxID=96232 RepID=A0ABW8D5V2_9GAMM
MAVTEDQVQCLLSSDTQKMTEEQQIYLLHAILEDAKQALDQEKDKDVYKLISDFQALLEHRHFLSDARENVNKLIALLEQREDGKSTLAHFKKHGVYRILYRNPTMRGQQAPEDDDLNQLLRAGYAGIGISAVIIAFFVATTLVGGAPFWLTAISAGLFTGASTYLSGILYGVVNDLFATKANLPYFLLGHQPQQTSMLRTNNKIAQGIAWGVAATFGPVVLASVLFTLVATVTAFFVPLATFVLPAMMIAMPLIAVGAEIYARKMAIEHQNQRYIHNLTSRLGINSYQKDGIDLMCQTPHELAAWLANGDRNLFGFQRVPLIGLGALAGFVGLSVFSTLVPPVLFASPIIAMAVPAAFAAVAALTLAAGGVYTYANRNTMLDDRYRMEFEGDIKPELYIDEDAVYVQTVLRKYPNPADAPRVNPTPVSTQQVEEPKEVAHFAPVISLPNVGSSALRSQKEERDENQETHGISRTNS